MVIIGKKRIYHPEEGERKQVASQKFTKLFNLLSEGVGTFGDELERSEGLLEIQRTARDVYKHSPEILERGVEVIYDSNLITQDDKGYDVFNSILYAVPESDRKTREDLAKIRLSHRGKVSRHIGHLVTSSIFATIGLSLLLIFASKFGITGATTVETANVDVVVSFIGAVVFMGAIWFLLKLGRNNK